MLLLVFTYRHLMGVIEHNVGCLQDGIIEQPHAHALLFGRFIFELRHALQPSQRRDAVQQPTAFGMGRNVTLHKQGAFVRINAGGQQDGGQRPRLKVQLNRILRHGDAVQINDTKEVFLLILTGYPIFDGTQIVPYVYIPGWLDAAKYASFGCRGHH